MPARIPLQIFCSKMIGWFLIHLFYGTYIIWMKNETRRSWKYIENTMTPIHFMWRLIRYYMIYHVMFPKKCSIFHSRYEKAHLITFFGASGCLGNFRKKKTFFDVPQIKSMFQILGYYHFGLCLEIAGRQTQTHTHEQKNN